MAETSSVGAITGSGEPTDAEISLVSQAKTFARAAQVRAQNANTALSKAEDNLAEFTELVLVENSNIVALRPLLEEARQIIRVIKDSNSRIALLSDQADIQAEKAEDKLGFGEAAIQPFVDKLEGSADTTGILEQIGDENDVLVQQASLLETKLLGLKLDLDLFNKNLQKTQESIEDIVSAELFINNLKKTLDDSGVSFTQKDGTTLKLLTAYNALQDLAFKADGTRKTRPQDLLKKALKERDWTEAKSLLNDAFVLATGENGVAVAQESAVLGTVGVGGELTDHIEGVWATRVAPGLFSFTSAGEVILRPLDEDQDIVTQAGYIELVNIIHSIEQSVQQESSLFTREEEKQFWGVEKIDVIVEADGTERFSNRILRGAEKGVERVKHVTAWENGKILDEKGEEVAFKTLDEITTLDFSLSTIRRIALQVRHIGNMAIGSSLSPDLTAQLQWVSRISGAFTKSLKDFNNAGRAPEVLLAREDALKTSFQAWIDLGGLKYIQRIKEAIRQATLQAEESGGIRLRPAIQDIIFFEYASTGEATLNRQIGQLGETMRLLSNYLENLNIVDALFSKTELPVDHRGKITRAKGEDNPPWTNEETVNFLDGLNELYKLWNKNSGSDTKFADVGALNFAQKEEVGKLLSYVEVYLKDGLERPDDIIDTDSTLTTEQQREEKERLTDALANALDVKFDSVYRINDHTFTRSEENFIDIDVNIVQTGGILTTELSVIKKRLFRLFNDDNFQQVVAAAVTHGQGVNDTAKQKLKKTMFVYQEFIKSAGSVLDKINDIIKSMAQRIGR